MTPAEKAGRLIPRRFDMCNSADGRAAVIGWTERKTGIGEVPRGNEWNIFDEGVTKIREIRAHDASPVNKAEAVNKLHGFDYEGRGYHMAPPKVPGC